MTEQLDKLRLKWGTVKAYHLHSEAALKAMHRYEDMDAKCISAMGQRDSDEEKIALCEAIDALNNEQVYLDWDGIYVSKEQAKEYVMNYGKK